MAVSPPLAEEVSGWHFRPMSKVEMIEAELQTLSQSELRQVRAWLDDLLEDELEFNGEFEARLRASEHVLAQCAGT